MLDVYCRLNLQSPASSVEAHRCPGTCATITPLFYLIRFFIEDAKHRSNFVLNGSKILIELKQAIASTNVRIYLMLCFGVLRSDDWRWHWRTLEPASGGCASTKVYGLSQATLGGRKGAAVLACKCVILI